MILPMTGTGDNSHHGRDAFAAIHAVLTKAGLEAVREVVREEITRRDEHAVPPVINVYVTVHSPDDIEQVAKRVRAAIARDVAMMPRADVV